ncbi:MAG: hypothetical protein U0547_03400 [Dehalococcoidia bacterium]
MPGRLIAGLIVGLLLVGVAGSAVLVTANDGGGPSAVTLFEQRGGQPVVTTYPSAAEAAAAAAKVSGAAVPVAGAPAGFRLVSFTIYPMPPFPASGMPTRVEAKYEKGSTWVKLLYVGSRFGFPGDEDAANRLPPPKAGQDLFRITTKDFIEYTVLTADRGFVVTLPNPSPLTEAEAIRVLTSVAN